MLKRPRAAHPGDCARRELRELPRVGPALCGRDRDAESGRCLRTSPVSDLSRSIYMSTLKRL